MDVLLDWLKPIIYFSIFTTVLLQLLPGTKYKKYIQFFVGLLMIVLVMGPLLTLIGEEDISKKVFAKDFYQETTVDLEKEIKEWETQTSAYYEMVIEKGISEEGSDDEAMNKEDLRELGPVK